MHLKNALLENVKQLQELESHARQLKNQNFADIVAAGHRRIAQLTEHPDIDEVHKLYMGGRDDEASALSGRTEADRPQAVSGTAHGGQGGAPFPT